MVNIVNKTFLEREFKKAVHQGKDWATSNILGIFIFNLLVVLMLLLKSAGYFAPFLPLTNNILFFISLVLLVILLGFRSEALFLIALIFLLFTGTLRTLAIDIWAERSSLYMFEALILGVAILIISGIKNDD